VVRERYDVIAIGGGAAGLVVSAGAAGLGARTALVERERLGGECLWTGCIPSKALLAAARAAADARAATRYGIHVGTVEVDFPAVMRWVHGARAAIAPHDSPERFRGLGVDVVIGTARFVDERCIEVDGRRLEARHVVVATGSRPLIPDLDGIDDVPYLTNETVFEIDEQPRRLIVLGGGAVGLELAQAFARLGSEVDVVEARDRLLPHEDDELVERLLRRLTDDGVRIHAAAHADHVRRSHAGIQLTATQHGGRLELHADALLVAAGRRPNLDHLDPGSGGVRCSEAGVIVDARLRTTARGTWAAGDVVAGAPHFTHVADYHARTVLRNALFPLGSDVDYSSVPWVTYTDPELAHLGLTEAVAKELHGEDVAVFTRELGSLDRAIADGRTEGLIKVIADSKGRILGAHAFGYDAGSVIAEMALAMRHGIRLDKLAATVHAYPTYPEAFRQTGDAFNRTRLTGTAARMVEWLVRRA
jgi:pyruvate/2-oxoglutarate dehydrogenase complex dihydrolipoamide dehydrogenase (E3) component